MWVKKIDDTLDILSTTDIENNNALSVEMSSGRLGEEKNDNGSDDKIYTEDNRSQDSELTSLSSGRFDELDKDTCYDLPLGGEQYNDKEER